MQMAFAVRGVGGRGSRSGIKKEAEGRVTAAELSAPSARSSRHDEGLWPVIIEGKFYGSIFLRDVSVGCRRLRQ